MKKSEFLTIFATYDALSTIQAMLPPIVEESRRAGAALIVHDSTDGEHKRAVWDWLQELNREEDFFLILSSNMSMAHARNMCLRLGTELYAPDYVCMLEDDHSFRPGAIPEMIATMRQYYGQPSPNGLRYGLFTACGECWGREYRYHRTPDGHAYPDADLPPEFLGGANSCCRCAPASHWNAVLKGYDPDEYSSSDFQTRNCNLRNYHNGFTTLVVRNGAFLSSVQRLGRGMAQDSSPLLFDSQYTASDRRSRQWGRPQDPPHVPDRIDGAVILEPTRGADISGFSDLERGSDGSSWRWALGPHSRLSINAARESEVLIEFELLSPIDGQVVELACNGSRLSVIEPPLNEWVSQSLHVRMQPGRNELVFRYRDWNGQFTVISTQDERPMAVRFARLDVREAETAEAAG